MRLKTLVVNADDFGYTPGVNRAIVDGFRAGIVTSATLMANGMAFDDAVRLAKENVGLGVGCHANLVEGDPIAPPVSIPNLLDADGRLIGLRGLVKRLAVGQIKALEIERECNAQVEKLLAAGIRPSHLDTHKHTHIAPQVASALASVAKRHGIEWIRRPFENAGGRRTSEPPARWALGRSLNILAPRFERMIEKQGLMTANYFAGFALTGKWSNEAMEAALRAVQPGITELMCHPGYADSDLQAAPTRLQTERQTEFSIFSDPRWRTRCMELGIMLASYRGLSFSAAAAGAPVPVKGAAKAVETLSRGK